MVGAVAALGLETDMGFGGFMVGLIGYGFGCFMLLTAALCVRDYFEARRSMSGRSADGYTKNRNLSSFVKALVLAFAAFAVTRALL